MNAIYNNRNTDARTGEVRVSSAGARQKEQDLSNRERVGAAKCGYVRLSAGCGETLNKPHRNGKYPNICHFCLACVAKPNRRGGAG